MCGIAGLVGSSRLSPHEIERLARVNDALFHRGPDSGGHFVEPGLGRVAFAMRRLAIIDVEGGVQPLFNEDESLSLVANGEIYNADELRETLQSQGHRFRTGSDCEVILHLYEQLGDACLHKLRGMFAFALYDGRRRRVLIARDRLGEKPLYIHRAAGRLHFASEAKALVRAGIVPFEMNASSILRYLHWGFVAGADSAIENVSKLLPGCYLTVELDGFEVREKRYWDARKIPAREGSSVELIRAEVEEACRLTVRSDVPVGVCLSAGVDSGVIATLAARYSQQSVCGVTVGFVGNPRQDERDGARRLAEHLKIPFALVELSPADAARALPAVCGTTDEPVSDSAGVSIYCMMEQCRAQGLKVMLTGLGGDELFWGYPWVQRAVDLSARKYARVGGTARMLDYCKPRLPALSYNQVRSWLGDAAGLRSGLQRWQTDAEHPDRLVFWDLSPLFQEAMLQLPDLLEPSWLEQVGHEAPFEAFRRTERPERIDLELMCTLQETYLCENGLGQNDRLSSAHSVEMRNPLVDHSLAELAIGLQRASPTYQNGAKSALLAAIDDLLPEWVKSRPKTGFSNPWREWETAAARQHGLLLIDGVLVQRGILRPERAVAVRKGLEAGVLGTRNDLANAILRLELWARSMEKLAS